MTNIILKILFFPFKLIGSGIKGGIYKGIVEFVSAITIIVIIAIFINGKL